MDRNRDIFVRKWSGQLTCHYTSHIPWASRGAFLLATRQSLARVLVLDHDTPCAARDSGSVRMLNFIRVLLGRRHHVTFAGVESDADDACALQLQALGAHVTSAGLLKFRSLSMTCDFPMMTFCTSVLMAPAIAPTAVSFSLIFFFPRAFSAFFA